MELMLSEKFGRNVMSPNNNYNAGRAFEYKRKNLYKREGFEVIRASGSHGEFDLICIAWDKPTLCIQCKRTDKRSTANRLLKQFKDHSPLQPSKFITQIMEIYVKEDREVLSVEVRADDA